MFSLKDVWGQPKRLILLEALLMLGFIGWVDYITKWEVSFLIFYALPIALVVWGVNQHAGFLFAVLCSFAWGIAQIPDSPFQTAFGLVWGGLNRMFYFFVVVVAVSTVKASKEKDRARIVALEREQELEREILRVSEQEQRRIGRDLHDGLGPHLAAIRYAATLLAQELRKHDMPEAETAEKLQAMAGDAGSLTRGIARGIFPARLDSVGLPAALEEFAANISKTTGKSVTFCASGDIEFPDPEDATHIYRIVQEAVNNALKHGAAEHVSVILSKDGGAFNLSIVDDGKGMSPSAAAAPGMGLQSMRYRAHALKGELTIESRPNEGTIISCRIPGAQPTSSTAPS